MSKLRENIDRILGNSIRCLLPSYWWKRIFGLVVDEVEKVDSKFEKAIESSNDKITNIESRLPSAERVFFVGDYDYAKEHNKQVCSLLKEEALSKKVNVFYVREGMFINDTTTSEVKYSVANWYSPDAFQTIIIRDLYDPWGQYSFDLKINSETGDIEEILSPLQRVTTEVVNEAFQKMSVSRNEIPNKVLKFIGASGYDRAEVGVELRRNSTLDAKYGEEYAVTSYIEVVANSKTKFSLNITDAGVELPLIWEDGKVLSILEEGYTYRITIVGDQISYKVFGGTGFYSDLCVVYAPAQGMESYFPQALKDKNARAYKRFQSVIVDKQEPIRAVVFTYHGSGGTPYYLTNHGYACIDYGGEYIDGKYHPWLEVGFVDKRDSYDNSLAYHVAIIQADGEAELKIYAYDSELSKTSTNAVQNKVVTAAINDKVDKSEIKTINGQSIIGEGDIELDVDTSNLATKAEVNAKQDTITDLDTIRANASKGATALQSVPSEYATKTDVSNAIAAAITSTLNTEV